MKQSLGKGKILIPNLKLLVKILDIEEINQSIAISLL